MKYFKKICGERVYLSPMSEEDIPTLTKWVNDFAVSDGIGQSARILSLEGERSWFEGVMKSEGHLYAIVRHEDDKMIGSTELSGFNSTHRLATFGISIGEEENRGRGYGLEATRLILGYGFDYLNLNNIMLTVFAFNEKAIKTYKEAGFQEIGRRREAYYIKNKYYDEIFMDITRADWYK